MDRLDTQATSDDESFSLLPSILGGVVVAALLSPFDDYFLGNLLYYWMPQAVVLGIVLMVSSRPAVLSGVALTLALYLAVYGAWIFFFPTSDGLVWLGYWFSLPGASIGAVIGAIYVRKRHYERAVVAGAVAALSTLVGLSLNQALLCSTLMSCRI